MTVYNQFGSRRGLLESLFDSFAIGGGLQEGLAAAFQREDPLEALTDLVGTFARFWESGRLACRRVRALAMLDPELGEAVEARNRRRREGVSAVVDWLGRRYSRPAPEEREQAIEILYMLTSFESFDTLAGPTRSLEEITPVIVQLSRVALGLAQLPPQASLAGALGRAGGGA